jgi:leucyl-tRNA synthetase
MSPVDWCPNCNTTLAREQVWGDDRHCERCDTQVIKKDLEQWFFRTTQYTEELLDFSDLDWPDRVRTLQEKWIGRSEGASVTFTTATGEPLEVFTTRPDTLWGVTFMVLAPEHPVVQHVLSLGQKQVVDQYIQQAVRQSEIQREAADKEKTGVFTGAYAINPVNGVQIPIWIADYVLLTYGTGAIMGVPAHDERDFAFAMKYGLPIIPVIEPPGALTKSYVLSQSVDASFHRKLDESGIRFDLDEAGNYAITLELPQVPQFTKLIQDSLKEGYWNEVVGTHWTWIFKDGSMTWDSAENDAKILQQCQALIPEVAEYKSLMEMVWKYPFYRDVLFHTSYGTMIHSGDLSGTDKDQAKARVIDRLEVLNKGKGAINYRLRDWLISRQRYWGAPIPMVKCVDCGWNPVPEDQLPVHLPDDVEWKPTGESPLKLHPTWKLTTCPVCGKQAERETDTMDTFMCSSWYHLRYLSPEFDQGPYDPGEYQYWMPVDTYTGGIEHATMHLIYTRFFHKACRDMGITVGNEPMIQLRNQGMVLGAGM